MLRLIQFFANEGILWPLCALALMGRIYHVETRSSGRIPFLLLSIGCFVAPYFARKYVELRYRRVKRMLLNTFVAVAIAAYIINRFADSHVAMYLVQSFVSLAFGCLFWAVSDPAYELIEWLSFPTEHGRPPDEIQLLDHRIVALAEGQDSELCWLFRYRYGNEWDVGITGPFTFSLMEADLDGKPVEEIYSAYGRWSSIDEIREMLGRKSVDGPSSQSSDSST